MGIGVLQARDVLHALPQRLQDDGHLLLGLSVSSQPVEQTPAGRIAVIARPVVGFGLALIQWEGGA